MPITVAIVLVCLAFIGGAFCGLILAGGMVGDEEPRA